LVVIALIALALLLLQFRASRACWTASRRRSNRLARSVNIQCDFKSQILDRVGD